MFSKSQEKIRLIKSSTEGKITFTLKEPHKNDCCPQKYVIEILRVKTKSNNQ